MVANLAKYANEGLLILRVGFGIMFLFYGLPKLLAGPQKWQEMGQAMNYLHISFWPVFWGFCAVFVQSFGGLCLILGLFFRPVCLLLFVVMAVAANMHLQKGDGLFGAAHALEDGLVFLALFAIGPGKYSLDKFF
ncbi:MAG: DoxX family protein [Candidatus Omnitrophota bacterium]